MTEQTVERAARALAALDHTEDWSGRGNYDDLAEWEQVAAKDAARAALAAAGAGAEVDREALATRARRAADTVDASDHPDCDHRRWDCDRTIEAWSDGEKFTTDDLRTLADLAARGDAASPTVTAADFDEAVIEFARATGRGGLWDDPELPFLLRGRSWVDEQKAEVRAVVRFITDALGIEVEGGGQHG